MRLMHLTTRESNMRNTGFAFTHLISLTVVHDHLGEVVLPQRQPLATLQRLRLHLHLAEYGQVDEQPVSAEIQSLEHVTEQTPFLQLHRQRKNVCMAQAIFTEKNDKG